ncbi:MAG TPA: hypothetical protein VJB98_02830 [Candidatus Paceibacterota bacterium]
MDLSGNFLKRFLQVEKDTSHLAQKVISIIQSEIGADIKPEQVSFRNGTITISAPSIVKSEIYLKKEEILKLLQKEINSPKILDLR